MSDNQQDDLKELHNAINDFQGALQKLKGSKTLKNYHRLYLRGLKDKAKAVSEKELAKIQQLIPPGIGTDHNVNIYVFLRKKAAIRDIRIPIVETLFVSKKNRTAVYMGNSSSGKITLIEKETAYKEFFLALSQGYNCNEPVCIYKPYEGKNIQNPQKSTDSLIGIARTIIAQRSLGKKKQFSVITNDSFYRNHYRKSMESSAEHTRKSSLEGIDAELVATCADTLVDEAPNKLKGSMKNEEEFGQTNRFVIMGQDLQRFIVNGSNSKTTKIDEIKHIDAEIRDIINKTVELFAFQASKDKKQILEGTFDFMKNKSKKWLILKCDKLLLNENPKKYKELIVPDIKQLNRSILPFIFPKPLNLENNDIHRIDINQITSKIGTPMVLKRHFTKIEISPMRKITIDTQDSPQALDIEERLDNFNAKIEKLSHTINPSLVSEFSNNAYSYQTSFLNCAKGLKQNISKIKRKSNLATNSISDKAKSFMKNVITEYDSILLQVQREKLREQRPLIEQYGGEIFWKKSMASLYSSLIHSSHLNRHFCTISKESFKKMSAGLICVFNSSLDIEFRRKMRGCHPNLCITSKDFSLFRDIFITVLRDLSVSTPHLHIIQDNLESLQSSIISKHV